MASSTAYKLAHSGYISKIMNFFCVIFIIRTSLEHPLKTCKMYVQGQFCLFVIMLTNPNVPNLWIHTNFFCEIIHPKYMNAFSLDNRHGYGLTFVLMRTLL